ncbi:hypothetical protein AKJ54_00910 [candidate division MSBL1 archaeon SCGC-AAA382K21]|uniref:Uncharacterized protein n=1 Tax=candidate division MSBL1 archaeon SCGC-AAA382K21 TaxID=1698283 RepID=A0A133VKI2_9EURY|nr:hypothetical protein AKJ54_00910 [candidate division MSBL1 archaeon SCGC-AAA382K21]
MKSDKNKGPSITSGKTSFRSLTGPIHSIRNLGQLGKVRTDRATLSKRIFQEEVVPRRVGGLAVKAFGDLRLDSPQDTKKYSQERGKRIIEDNSRLDPVFRPVG